MKRLLHSLFGPSRKEIWAQLAHDIDGEFISDSWVTDKVMANHKDWVITLDRYRERRGNHSVTFTRIRVPYINKDGFRFTIYRESFFSSLGKFLGMQDVEVGYEKFDDDFIIKGNDEYKLWKLFKNDKIRDLIKQQRQVHLSVTSPADNNWFVKKFDKNVDEVQFKVRGTLTDLAQLKSLFDLFAEVLDHLCAINAAYEHNPRTLDS